VDRAQVRVPVWADGSEQEEMPHVKPLHILHPGKLLLFAGLSATDLILTYRLVEHSGGQVYEGNPIANAWLSSYGWAGLALFKLAAMLLVAGTATFISLSQPRKAGHVLRFACVALGSVVVYSCWLLGLFPGQASARTLTLAQAEKAAQELDLRVQAHCEYLHLMENLTEEILAGTCTLEEAVDQAAILRDNEQTRIWVETLHLRYPGLTDHECLAADLRERLADRRADELQGRRRAAGASAPDPAGSLSTKYRLAASLGRAHLGTVPRCARPRLAAKRE
jgi:hypothetical protein